MTGAGRYGVGPSVAGFKGMLVLPPGTRMLAEFLPPAAPEAAGPDKPHYRARMTPDHHRIPNPISDPGSGIRHACPYGFRSDLAELSPPLG